MLAIARSEQQERSQILMISRTLRYHKRTISTGNTLSVLIVEDKCLRTARSVSRSGIHTPLLGHHVHSTWRPHKKSLRCRVHTSGHQSRVLAGERCTLDELAGKSAPATVYAFQQTPERSNIHNV